MKIAVAMSGGVDSSVAAALMVEKYGKENVFGVTAKLFCYSGQAKEKACCSLEAIDDAKQVCEKLGIAHYVINEEEEFRISVIKNFISAYRHGQTPIPCIPCNTLIKFGSMLEKVKKIGAEKVATGHFARIEKVKGCNSKKSSLKYNTYNLKRGNDKKKDQTYFLHGLNQEQLSNIEFPIGEMEKKEVRKIAKEIGLNVAEKKESQGVCFVTEERVADYLKGKIESKPGNIVDRYGNVVGKHDGYIFYTIGQRKRIGGGFSNPMFVIEVNPLTNEVIIGTRDELYKNELMFFAGHWISGNEPKLPLKCTAKIRYNSKDEPCIIERVDSKYGKHYKAFFLKPQRAITPGQSIVLYDGEIVLGGGLISG